MRSTIVNYIIYYISNIFNWIGLSMKYWVKLSEQWGWPHIAKGFTKFMLLRNEKYNKLYLDRYEDIQGVLS